jgi:Family of unknown function (DUF6634)
MIRYPGGDDPATLVGAAARLAADVRRIRAGKAPTAADLDEAPILDSWVPAVIWQKVLAGSVTGHPLLGSRPFIRTSPLYVLDLEQGWVRTWSRFYRLGASAQQRAGGCNA